MVSPSDIGSDIRSDKVADVVFNQQRVAPLDFIEKSSVNPDASDLVITELRDTALVQVFAKQSKRDELANRLGIGTKPGKSTVTDRFTAMPVGPGQWMFSASAGADGSFCSSIREQLGDVGYVSEQSHSRVIIRLSGSNARALMQKGCRLDLHPRVASAGFCAQSPIAQVGVLIHQLDDSPIYDLHVYSGFAHSFWHWLTSSAAQFGYTAS